MNILNYFAKALLAPAPRASVAFGSVAVAVAAPTLLRASIDALVSGTTFVAYYPFVLLGAVCLGWRYAAVAALISCGVANFLFMAPRYTFFADFSDTGGALSFILSSAMIIALAEALRRTVQQVEAGQRYATHLNGELQHRIKNTLAVIQGLAIQTFREPGAAAELRKFQGRIKAFATAQDVLSTGTWETCRLPDLAVRALEPFNSELAIGLDGPPCTLGEESCVPLVLALHELATNSVKYGALSVGAGTVTLHWTLNSHPETVSQELTIEWGEHGGPEVRTPEREGLGSRLLKPQKGLKDVSLAFLSSGVRCLFVVAGVNKAFAGQEHYPVTGNSVKGNDRFGWKADL